VALLVAFGCVRKDLFHWDEDIQGFGLRVEPSGIKSYIVQYRQNGRSRRMTLGRLGVLTAEEARKLAKMQLVSVAHGQDPVEERYLRRKAPTMKDLCDDYMNRHALPNKRPVSVRDDRSMIEGVVLQKLGTRKVDCVKRRDLEILLQRMKDTPYRANRVRALLSNMFSLAVAWGWRADNPVRGIEMF